MPNVPNNAIILRREENGKGVPIGDGWRIKMQMFDYGFTE